MTEYETNGEHRKDEHSRRSGLSRRTFLTCAVGGSGAALMAGMLGTAPLAGPARTVYAATYGDAEDCGVPGGGANPLSGCGGGALWQSFDCMASMKAADLAVGTVAQTAAYYETSSSEPAATRGGALYRIVSRADYDGWRGNSFGPEDAANGGGFVDHLLANGRAAVLLRDGAVNLAAVGLREGGDAHAVVNAAALQAALAYPLRTLAVFGTYSVGDESIADLGETGELDLSGDGGFRLASDSIVNTDADYGNHKAILRIQGGRRFSIRGVRFDGNRDGQTYPATRNNFGRGTVPRRTNGMLEVCPSAGLYRPQTVIVENCAFENAYLSGVMFIQCERVSVRNNDSANNTINGFGGAGIGMLLFEGNVSRRDGWSDIYTSDRYDGDRAQLQIREWPKDYTSATERIPVIAIAESERNRQIVVRGNTSDQSGVIGLFVRSCEQCVIADNVIRNVGYRRRSGSYSPTAIWGDFGKFSVTGNEIMTLAPQPGDMRPDGIRIVGFTGNGIDQNGGPWISMRGRYYSLVADNRIACGETFAAGPFDDNANKRLLTNKGIIVTSQCLVRGNVIEGCADVPIEAINDTNFGNESLRDVGICDNVIFNTTAVSAINLRSYGSPVGSPRGFDIRGNTVYDARSATAGSDARQMVNFSPAWTSVAVNDVTVADNRFYCLNTADPTKNYGGVRFRGGPGSRGIAVRDNRFSDTLNAVRAESFAGLAVSGNSVSNGLRLLYADIAVGGDAGKLMVNGNSCEGITAQCVNINAGSSGHVLSELVAVGNSWSGSGATYAGLAPGVSPIAYCFDRNVDSMGTRVVPTRFFTGAPTFNAQYAGEVASSSDGSGDYIAVKAGTGAGDWKAL